MKFQSILLAVSAASAAVACPAGKKPKATYGLGSGAGHVAPSTPSAYPTPTTVPTGPAGVSPSPVPSSQASSSYAAASSPTASLATYGAAAAPSPAVQAAVVGSSSPGSSSSVAGEATFYGGNLSGGTCSFTTLSTIPNNLYGTAFSGFAWDSAAQCGACVKVTGPNGNSITAMVVDQCPECEESHLDLFQDAFTKLGTASQGIIDISYDFVDCGITSPLVLHNKSGTSKYWFSMQVVGANGAVDKLEVSTDGGSTWQQTTRTEYNFFENTSGFGTDTVAVRVTSASGKTVTVKDVSCASESQTKAGSNF